jgi:hypothetical protein
LQVSSNLIAVKYLWTAASSRPPDTASPLTDAGLGMSLKMARSFPTSRLPQILVSGFPAPAERSAFSK